MLRAAHAVACVVCGETWLCSRECCGVMQVRQAPASLSCLHAPHLRSAKLKSTLTCFGLDAKMRKHAVDVVFLPFSCRSSHIARKCSDKRYVCKTHVTLWIQTRMSMAVTLIRLNGRSD